MVNGQERGGSTLDVKDFNCRRVLLALKSMKTATIREVATETGLSAVTVGSLVQDLLGDGLLREGLMVPSNGGRPSRSYHFNERKSLGLIVFTREVQGADTVCLRICDLYGSVIEAEDRPIQVTGLEAFEPPIDSLIAKYPAVGAIGFGLPGIEYGGTITWLDYKDLIGLPILDHFKSRYGLPVLFENDVNAAVRGRGILPGSCPVEVYLYFPRKYVPGAGIRIDGKILKGRHHFAGEISNLPLNVAWGSSALASSFEGLTEGIAKVVVSLVSVLDPDSVIIFGEFLTPGHLESVRDICTQLLPEGMMPQVGLAEDFSRDFETGLIDLTLELIAKEKE